MNLFPVFTSVPTANYNKQTNRQRCRIYSWQFYGRTRKCLCLTHLRGSSDHMTLLEIWLNIVFFLYLRAEKCAAPGAETLDETL